MTLKNLNANDETGLRNLMRVWEYYKARPCGTQVECAAFLKLHRLTVGKHVKQIRLGWGPSYFVSSDNSK